MKVLPGQPGQRYPGDWIFPGLLIRRSGFSERGLSGSVEACEGLPAEIRTPSGIDRRLTDRSTGE
jgi:hypothetical protein